MVATSVPDRKIARVAVFGSGLIGCYIGGRLASGGADVTLIGRARVIDPIRAAGLRVTDLKGADIRLAAGQLRLSEDPAALAGADLVIVAVKSLATGEAAQQIAAYAPSAIVISFQNGVSNGEVLKQALPQAIVAAGSVPFNIASPDPAHVHQGTAGNLSAALEPELQPWLPVFAAGGIPLTLHPDMPAVLWGKLIMNLNNAINALSGLPLADELGQRDFRRAVALTQREALKLLRRARITPADYLGTPVKALPFILSLPTFIYRRLMAARGFKVDRHARSSMAEDLEAGRPTEIDFLNGEVVALAHRHGRTAPANARVVELIQAAEKGAHAWKARPLLTALKAAGTALNIKIPPRRGV